MAAGASLILHVVLIVFSLCLRLQSLLSFRLGLWASKFQPGRESVSGCPTVRVRCYLSVSARHACQQCARVQAET